MNSNTSSSNVRQMIWSLLAPIPDRNTSPIVGQTMELVMPWTHRGFMGDCQNHYIFPFSDWIAKLFKKEYLQLQRQGQKANKGQFGRYFICKQQRGPYLKEKAE